MNTLSDLAGRARTALGLGRVAKSAPSRMPDGALVYAVGDIHGRADLLELLVAKINMDARTKGMKPTVVFVGDYVDRGTDSKGVIELLLNGLPMDWTAIFLKGNHEEAMLTFIEDPAFGDTWQDFGGLQTLTSYGVALPRRAGEIDWPAVSASFAAALPRAHRDFLRGLTLRESIGDYVFVHAGVRPRIPLEYQSEKDLLWIREEFTAAGRALPQTVVYGHTPSEEVVVGPGRIGIDTGAYATGKLTAAGFQGSDVWYLST